MNRSLCVWRLLALACLALLAPAALFLILGHEFENQLQSWVQHEWPDRTRFCLIVLVLSLDLVLPVPSSGVSTYAGGTLGLVWGTAASWLGMSVGAACGFALARALGRPFAQWCAGPDLARLQPVSNRYGEAVLIVTRFLPLLAEGCVLLAGVMRMRWRRFLPAVAAANLVISLTYAAFGAYLGERHALPAAIVVSVLLPLTIAIVVRRRLQWTNDPEKPTGCNP